MKKIQIVLIIGVLLMAVGGWIAVMKREPTTKTPVATQTPASTSTPKPTSASATLEIFDKPVFLLAAGSTEEKEASDGAQVPEGTTVKTGEKGRAQLIFPNKSVTRLDTNTQVTLQKITTDPAQVSIKLEKRRIWNRVAKLLGTESFINETSTVVATVRGTSFGMGILPDGRNRVISKKGLIETRCVNESQSAEVVANKKILHDCTSGGKLPLLELDEQIKDKDEWFFFNEEQDKMLDERFGKEIYSE